ILTIGASSAYAEPISFKGQIAPILIDNCLACHGPKKAEGGYRVDSYERVMKEGESASPGFAAADLDGSEAFRRISSDNKDERMPKDSDPLPADKIALFKQWITEGAKFDGPNPQAPL